MVKDLGYYMVNEVKIKKLIFKELHKNIKEIIKLKPNRHVYKITLDNNSIIRLDIDTFSLEINRLQQIALDHGINVPNIIKSDSRYKISEWIEGVRILDVWDTKEVFYKSGELMAKLNLIKDPKTNGYLINTEFSSTNAIWTPAREVYIIDHDKLRTTENIEIDILSVLLKRIRNKERIEIFLSGYSKYRDTNKIIEELNKRNWQWSKEKPLQDRKPLC